MKFASSLLLLIVASCLTLPSIAQSKKDIIAAQSTAMDTMEQVMDKQHELILKATERIEDLMQQITDLKFDLEVVTVANDTLRSQLAHQKKITHAERVSRPYLTIPSSDLGKGLIDRRSALVHFSSSEDLDHVILETKGVDLLSGITTLRVFDPERELIFEQNIETTTIDELDSDPELQRCIISRRLSEALSYQTLVPVTRDRNGEWRVISPDLISVLPDIQCGILLREHIEDPLHTLFVFDRSSKQLVRIRNVKR